MALTKLTVPVSRYDYFHYYITNEGTADETMSESLNPGVAFEFDCLRMHLSAAHSAVDLVVQISSILDSRHDLILLSHPMNGLTEIFWGPDRPLILQASDTINVTMINSAGDAVGMILSGWSVTS